MTDLNKNLIKNTENTEPVRLNKYLSDAGFCSRREADRLIEAGRVSIDGCAAVMGQKVEKGQKVLVDGKEIKPQEKMILIAFNKPAGVECTSASDNPDNIIDYINYPERIYPIGRLDKPSTGLILLTNTGELVNGILKGSNYHEKEYVVSVDRQITAQFLEKMRAGVRLDDGVVTRSCSVKQTGKCTFNIILTQGLNRQIRRMCSALGYEVTSLHRIRVMNIKLGDLPEGKYREVTEPEVRKLIEDIQAGKKNG